MPSGELAALLAKRRKSIEDPAAAAAAMAHAERLDSLAAEVSSGARNSSASPSAELADRLGHRRRLSEAPLDAKEVRRAQKKAHKMQLKHKAGGDHFDKVTGELGKKLERQLAKERVEELRIASNIEASEEDTILTQAKAASSSDNRSNNLSPELANKLRRRRQSMGEEATTPSRMSGVCADKKLEEPRRKGSEDREDRGTDKNTVAPPDKTEADDYSSALLTFAIAVLLLFIAYFFFVMTNFSRR